jgi:hypothetical protein
MLDVRCWMAVEKTNIYHVLSATYLMAELTSNIRYLTSISPVALAPFQARDTQWCIYRKRLFAYAVVDWLC